MNRREFLMASAAAATGLAGCATAGGSDGCSGKAACGAKACGGKAKILFGNLKTVISFA